VHTGYWWGNLKEGDHLEDLGGDGGINIKMDFKEIVWECMGLNLSDSRWGQVVGCCEHCSELLGCIKYGEFLG
jgi:hypothetical protein